MDVLEEEIGEHPELQGFVEDHIGPVLSQLLYQELRSKKPPPKALYVGKPF